ncbi:MAG TPA: DUF5694 domain-containing protein [Sphingomicrobium sp.]|nr:DUF5694 domain-containing protein [Sphingomicrobium sp.]
MRWVIGTLAMAIACQASAAGSKTSAPVEVMILGTYHFDNPGRDLANVKADDVLKPQRQKELEALSMALAEFRPTKIAVERIAKTPELRDHRYAEFVPADLGKNRDERFQVAYRLANRLGFNSVYAIDEDPAEGEPDYFPFGKVVEWAKANGAEAKLNSALDEVTADVARISQLQAENSIASVLVDLNWPDKAEQAQRWHYRLFAYGDTDKQPGADLNAMWYLRNAKIFAKLTTIAKPGDRVLVVYGSGHNYWLRHFAQTTPGYRNVDPTPYLQKAARAPR